MLNMLYWIGSIIGNETPQQIALGTLILGACGLGLIGIVVRLISKIKAVAFFGG